MSYPKKQMSPEINAYLKEHGLKTRVKDMVEHINKTYSLNIGSKKVRQWLCEIFTYSHKPKVNKHGRLMNMSDKEGMPVDIWLDRIDSKGCVFLSDYTIETINPARFASFLNKNSLTICPFGSGMNIIKKAA